MTREEAKTIFLNRGYIEVDGGSYFDGNKWRESITVISEWLKEEPLRSNNRNPNEGKEGDWMEIDFIQPKKTVGKLISIDVLDKIRAEIEEYKLRQLTLAIGVDDLEKGKK